MLRTRLIFTTLIFLVFSLPMTSLAADHPLAGIPLRNIGPALTSGRVSDFAFVPGKPQSFYVSMASGGLWKTENNGTTWKPLFDNYSSITLGDIAVSQSNENFNQILLNTLEWQP